MRNYGRIHMSKYDRIQETLLELVELQNNQDYNAVNERILEAEENGGADHEAGLLFEKYYANEQYAQWHKENSDQSDNIEE